MSLVWIWLAVIMWAPPARAAELVDVHIPVTDMLSVQVDRGQAVPVLTPAGAVRGVAIRGEMHALLTPARPSDGAPVANRMVRLDPGRWILARKRKLRR